MKVTFDILRTLLRMHAYEQTNKDNYIWIGNHTLLSAIIPELHKKQLGHSKKQQKNVFVDNFRSRAISRNVVCRMCPYHPIPIHIEQIFCTHNYNNPCN